MACAPGINLSGLLSQLRHLRESLWVECLVQCPACDALLSYNFGVLRYCEGRPKFMS